MRRKIADMNTADKTSRRTATPTPVKPAKQVAAVAPPAAKSTAPKASTQSEAFPTTIKSKPQPATSTPSTPALKPDARKEAEAQALKTANQKTSAGEPPTAVSLIQAPPPAVSAAKQSRLNELLARYKADKITPEQYHTERARILSE
jgi:hypothetical protein